MAAREPAAEIRIEGGTLWCAGAWTVRELDSLQRLLARVAWPNSAEVALDGSGIGAFDLAGAFALRGVREALERAGHRVELRLRPEHEALLAMVSAPELALGPPPAKRAPGLLARIGTWALALGRDSKGVLAFVGQSASIAGRALLRPRRLRWRSVLHNVQAAGFDALPIVGLLSFLMGVVITYQGASQLRRYGANIFVVDLVGFAVLREISPLVTAIIVAGRSGSAFAAQLGTMRVTEEIDALTTVGVSPTELLVLPKVLALMVALPLLTVYADAVGVLGGMVMAQVELSVGWSAFLDRFAKAIQLSDYLVGVGKAPVFAGIIGVIGCFQGLQASGDAESVGRRTTVSVVQSVFLVIVADALFSVAFSALGL
ncbi:MAG TPA: ABC transporter permease [Anaeromyxobacteraceae bacterium]|nr:ABC transporter permease [Anaeromyxobacteraceae bacterium]